MGSAHAEVHYEIARKPPLALTSVEKLIRKLLGFLSVGVTQCSALSIQLNSSKVEYIATTHFILQFTCLHIKLHIPKDNRNQYTFPVPLSLLVLFSKCSNQTGWNYTLRKLLSVRDKEKKMEM